MARREILEYLLEKISEQDKELEEIKKLSSALVLELVSEVQHIKLAALEQRYCRCRLQCWVDETKCGLREKIGMLESYLHSSFQQAVEVEVESRIRQMKELTAVRANVDAVDIQDRAARHPNYESVLDNLKRMEIELRCGICVELMVSATTLNCMHTFCQCCITQWKTFEGHRETVARCPVCRDVTISEKRNYFADNLIGIMVDSYPEEEKNSRKELVARHLELTQNGGTPPETNSAIPFTNRFDQFMEEVEKQLKNIIEFLNETSVLPVSPLVPVRPEPPQPTRTEQLPRSLVAAVIPVQRRSSTQTSETRINPLNQQRVSEREQRDRQTSPATVGVLDPQPQAIQRAANRANQQSSARAASGRKVHGSLARPHWRY